MLLCDPDEVLWSSCDHLESIGKRERERERERKGGREGGETCYPPLFIIIIFIFIVKIEIMKIRGTTSNHLDFDIVKMMVLNNIQKVLAVGRTLWCQ